MIARDRNRLIAILALGVLGGSALLATRELRPPQPRDEGAPPEVFSAGRAMRHVEAIAATTHPIGSAAHDRARDHVAETLRSLGFAVEIERGCALNGGAFALSAATLENVIGTRPGATDRCVLLVAHYDSVPTGPGAGDDAAGVAAVLETARVLVSRPSARNSLAVLVTDGEESGLMGARLFLREHPLRERIGAVLNFEGRGHEGPSIMFQVGPSSGDLVAEYAAAVADPCANSLAADVYRHMPNDTDFSLFRRAGARGLNFAFIGGIDHYHTALDTPAELDRGSLQHHGDQMLAVATRLLAADFSDAARAPADRVWFSVCRTLVVHYPAWLRFPFALLALLALVTAIRRGWKRGWIGWRGLAFGLLVPAVSLAVCAAIAWGVASLVSSAAADSAALRALMISEGWRCAVGLSSIAVAIHALCLLRWRRESKIDGLYAGALAFAALPLPVALWLSPGATPYFTWPLLAGALALHVLVRRRERQRVGARDFAAAALATIPAVLMFLPLGAFAFQALLLGAAPLLAALVVIALGFACPLLLFVMAVRRWALAIAAGAAGVGFVFHAALGGSIDERRPQQDTLFCAIDEDSGQARYASLDAEVDAYTAQFLGAEPERADLSAFHRFLNDAAVADAPPFPVSGAEVEPVAFGAGTRRTLEVRVRLPEGAYGFSLALPPAARASVTAVDGVAVDAEALEQRSRFQASDDPASWLPVHLHCIGSPREGVRVAFDLLASDPVDCAVVAELPGVPSLIDPKPQRPNYLIPVPNCPDATLVRRTYRF